jgi:NAD(P)-dependent dehydrogenase (short-subunit alcohol dehydrogenase family)
VAAYAPSKTALNALTVQYANELRKNGILINAAAPGFCATDINNHSGHRTAAQGAAVVVRLATLGADGRPAGSSARTARCPGSGQVSRPTTWPAQPGYPTNGNRR